MTNTINVLDHGYVKFIEMWGSDERIVESARMSTDGAFRGWGPIELDETCPQCNGTLKVHTDWGIEPCMHCKGSGKNHKDGDEKLLRTLYEGGHSSPFEQAGMTVEVRAPIFVFREWHRHRTQSYNELSARYTKVPDLEYMPSMERLLNAAQAKANKQSSGAGISRETAELAATIMQEQYVNAREAYHALLELGIAREVARCVLPVAQYSKMRASANLTNWMRFLKLRLPKDAQFEIRQYANAVRSIIEERFPRSAALFLADM